MAKKGRGRPKGSKNKRGSRKPGPKKGSKRKGTTTARGSKESRYLDEGRKQGWNMGNWTKAKKDTKTCQNQALKQKDPIKRMVTYNKCRSSKRLK